MQVRTYSHIHCVTPIGLQGNGTTTNGTGTTTDGTTTKDNCGMLIYVTANI